MEAQIVKKSTAEIMHEVVDTRLSKGELIDIVIDRVLRDLNEQITSLEQEKKALDDAPVPLREVIALLRERGEVRVIEHHYHDDFEIRLSVRVLERELPEREKKRRAAAKALSARLGTLRAERSRLVNGKSRARIAMLQESLRSTPEGQRILEAIDDLKTAVRGKLLGA